MGEKEQTKYLIFKKYSSNCNIIAQNKRVKKVV